MLFPILGSDDFDHGARQALHSAYLWRRYDAVSATGVVRSAHEALRLAHGDVYAGFVPCAPRFSRCCGQPVRDTGQRYVDYPGLSGLRPVRDLPDVLVGWLVDRDDERLVHGFVFQLPARGGQPRYVAGFKADGETQYRIDFDTIFSGPAGGNAGVADMGLRHAAQAADRLASDYAVELRRLKNNNLDESVGSSRHSDCLQAQIQALGEVIPKASPLTQDALLQLAERLGHEYDTLQATLAEVQS